MSEKTTDPGPVPTCVYCGDETDGTTCDKVGCQMFETDLAKAVEKQELIEDDRIDGSMWP